MSSRWICTTLLWAAACGTDAGLVVFDSPPTAVILTPSDGQVVAEAEVFTLTGVVEDRDTAPEDLQVRWFVGDAQVCVGRAGADGDGNTWCETQAFASAVVTLVVVDDKGEEGHASVSFEVVANQPPSVRITTPSGLTSGTVPLTAVLADAEDAPEELTVVWTDYGEPLDMTGATVDDTGLYSAFAVLAPGEHHLRAEVLDTDGARALDTATVTLVNADQVGPRCDITAVNPTRGTAGEPVTFIATASDAVSGPDALTAVLSSSRDGVLFGPGPLDATGALSATTSTLSEGAHTISLAVTDEAGQTCEDAVPFQVCSTVVYADTDGDGFGDPASATVACATTVGFVSDATDCDDTTAQVYPGAAEVCDGVDNNCDGLADLDDPVLMDAQDVFADRDGDGFGDPSSPQRICMDAANAFVSNSLDCDDTTALANPAGVEVCDGLDNDCNGMVDLDDANLTDALVGYADVDADGFGDPTTQRVVCGELPANAVLDNTDCNDASALAHPQAVEVCDGLDNDCNGEVDLNDAGLIDGQDAYADVDQDGFGDPRASLRVCGDLPDLYVTDNTDCNDVSALAFPGAVEVCDGLDNDCNGAVDTQDAELTDGLDVYADMDQDGFGDATVYQLVCGDIPGGYVVDATDCNDASDAAFPGAPEVCDGIDNDCNGFVDLQDAAVADAFDVYADVDQDGFGDPLRAERVCAELPGTHVRDNTDCNDASALANPAAIEVCDGLDNDCNGAVDLDDAGLTDGQDIYADADRDGFGDPAVFNRVCGQLPDGYVSDSTDCNDASDAAFPGAFEVCDGLDNDCNGAVDTEDAGLIDGRDVFRDADGDGFGDPAQPLWVCGLGPSTHVADDTDCDDARAVAYPGGVEVCDGVDNDCNGAVDLSDAGLTDALTVFADTDADGFGDPSTPLRVCGDAPAGRVVDNTDCNDGSAAAFPGATEVCDGLDNDCNGATDLEDTELVDGQDVFADADADGFGDPLSALTVCGQIPGGYVVDATDCNDASAVAYPGASEVCDGLDNDCNGAVDLDDVGIADARDVYVDADQDGFGDPAQRLTVCGEVPGNYVVDATDCNDGSAAAFPGATEVCDGLDNDCNGAVDLDDVGLTDGLDLYRDADDDGFGDANDALRVCFNPPDTHVFDATDCDDTSARRYPDADEVCDGIDNNCDGSVDEDDPQLIAPTYYPDADGDGFGDATAPTVQCERPLGYLDDGDDCDDTRDTAYPGAPELCDGVQNDCSVPWTSDAGTASRFSVQDNAWVDETPLWAGGSPTEPLELTYDDPAGTRLQLCGGVWFVSIYTEEDLEITVPDGSPEVVLDGGGEHRVLYLWGPGTSTVAGVTIQNGSAALGGGMLTRAANTVVDSVHFRHNTAVSRGGAIHANTVGSQLTVMNSTFTHNACTTTGGGTAGGGAIHALRANVTVTDSGFVGNATGAAGGAILYQEDAAYSNIVLSDNTYTDNSARDGGAVFISSYGEDEPTVSDSVFAGNSATNEGGAVYVENLGVTPGVVRLHGNDLSNGSAVLGGFMALTTPTDIQHSTMTSASGGCIASTEYVQLQDVDLVGCVGGANGGAIRVQAHPEPTVLATDVLIQDATPSDVYLHFPADLDYTWPGGPHDFECDETCALTD